MYVSYALRPAWRPRSWLSLVSGWRCRWPTLWGLLGKCCVVLGEVSNGFAHLILSESEGGQRKDKRKTSRQP